MTPKISIVFTSYNHKEFLRQALDSLINQTFKEFELIVVDDCSTDGSQEVLKSYHDPRIRLFLNEKNSGSYVKSSNFGASKAVAPYILFAQCDDWAEPTQLERLVDCMETHRVGVVYSCSNMVDEKGTFMRTDFDGRLPSFKKKCATDTVIERKRGRHGQKEDESWQAHTACLRRCICRTQSRPHKQDYRSFRRKACRFRHICRF